MNWAGRRGDPNRSPRRFRLCAATRGRGGAGRRQPASRRPASGRTRSAPAGPRPRPHRRRDPRSPGGRCRHAPTPVGSAASHATRGSGRDRTGLGRCVATARRTAADGLVVGTSGNVSVRVGGHRPGHPQRRALRPARPRGRCRRRPRRPPGPRRPRPHQRTPACTWPSTAARDAARRRPHPRRARHRRLHPRRRGPARPLHDRRRSAAPSASPRYAALRHRRTGRRTCSTPCATAPAACSRNHGTVTYGDTLDQAYDRTAQLEWMCRLWLTASSVPGRTPEPPLPGPARRRARTPEGYGQPGRLSPARPSPRTAAAHWLRGPLAPDTGAVRPATAAAAAATIDPRRRRGSGRRRPVRQRRRPRGARRRPALPGRPPSHRARHRGRQITLTRSLAALRPGTYGLTGRGVHAVVGPVVEQAGHSALGRHRRTPPGARDPRQPETGHQGPAHPAGPPRRPAAPPSASTTRRSRSPANSAPCPPGSCPAPATPGSSRCTASAPPASTP